MSEKTPIILTPEPIRFPIGPSSLAVPPPGVDIMALHSAAGWDKPQQSLQELSLAVKSTWMHTSVALGPLQAQLLELAGRVAQLEQQLANVRAIDAEEAPPSE